VLAKINDDPDKTLAVWDELLEELVVYALKYLQPFQCSTDDASCRSSLQEIFHSAIQLDAKMNKQWAMLLPQYIWDQESIRRPYGFSFDPTLMEVSNGDNADLQQARVQLVLAPALIRTGTMDGEEYNEIKVLEKAQVHVECFLGFSARKPKAETAGDDIEDNPFGGKGEGLSKRVRTALSKVNEGLRH
jgi:hypothetical protein